MSGFFAFLGALLDEAKGAGATFRFGGLLLLVYLIYNHNVMWCYVPFEWKVW